MSIEGRHLRHIVKTQPSAVVGLAMVSVALVLAAIGPTVAPFDPQTAFPGQQLLPPSFTHLMGTDNNGMDVFSRVIASPRTDLTIAILGTLGAIAAGIPLGLIAGYYRGLVSEILMRLSDIVQSFPLSRQSTARSISASFAARCCSCASGHSSKRRVRSAARMAGSYAHTFCRTRSVPSSPTHPSP